MPHRYFTTDIVDDIAYLRGEDAQHLCKVLRARIGEDVLLCDGLGQDYDAQVSSIEDGVVTLRILHCFQTATEPRLHAEVFIGLAKGERMDYAIQKSVELGAAAVWTFESEHTVAKPHQPEKKTQRWQRIATEAAKQSGRGILPMVHPPLTFEDVLKKTSEFECTLFCYEEGGTSLRKTMQNMSRLAIITGPEGGFSSNEAQMATKAGCTTIGLGPRILRCETAPAAVLSAVMCLSGDLE